MTDAGKLTAEDERTIAVRQTEREDVLAYLARKRRNAEILAGRLPEFEEQARRAVRQFAVLEDDIRAGLHVGEVLATADRGANSAGRRGRA